MTIVRHADARRSETPNGVMTTLASPTQGNAQQALWRVDMGPGRSGPLHTFDAEQLYTVIEGAARLDLAGATHQLAPGDTAVLPADTPRQITADARDGVVAIVTSAPNARARTADGVDHGVPDWVA